MQQLSLTHILSYFTSLIVTFPVILVVSECDGTPQVQRPTELKQQICCVSVTHLVTGLSGLSWDTRCSGQTLLKKGIRYMISKYRNKSAHSIFVCAAHIQVIWNINRSNNLDFDNFLFFQMGVFWDSKGR